MSQSEASDDGLQRVRDSANNLENVGPLPATVNATALPSVDRYVQPRTNLSKMSNMLQLSTLSCLSASAFINPAWDREERDLFEERAAIIEFDGGLGRSQAEYLARRCIDNALRRFDAAGQ